MLFWIRIPSSSNVRLLIKESLMWVDQSRGGIIPRGVVLPRNDLVKPFTFMGDLSSGSTILVPELVPLRSLESFDWLPSIQDLRTPND